MSLSKLENSASSRDIENIIYLSIIAITGNSGLRNIKLIRTLLRRAIAKLTAFSGWANPLGLHNEVPDEKRPGADCVRPGALNFFGSGAQWVFYVSVPSPFD
jgi:hypothetical protein